MPPSPADKIGLRRRELSAADDQLSGAGGMGSGEPIGGNGWPRPMAFVGSMDALPPLRVVVVLWDDIGDAVIALRVVVGGLELRNDPSPG